MSAEKTHIELQKEITKLKSENKLLRSQLSNAPYLQKELLHLLSKQKIGFIFEDSDKLVRRMNAYCIDFFKVPTIYTSKKICRQIVLTKVSHLFTDSYKLINKVSNYLDAKEKVYNIPFALKDGRKISIDIIPILQEAKYVGSILLFREITSSTQQKSEENHKNIRSKFALEAIKDGLWDWDIITNEVYFSIQWKNMLGYADSEINNQLTEWESRVHPDDIKEVYRKIKKHLNGETSEYTSEHRVLCKDGSYKWILDRGKIISYNAQQEPQRIIGTHTDISFRKKTEERLNELNKSLTDERNMFIQGNVVVFKWKNAPNRPVEYVSRNVKDILGYTENEVYSNSFEYKSIIHPDDVKDFSERLFESNHYCCNSFEHKPYRLLKSDGNYICVHDYTIIIRDNKDNITHFLGYLIDITDLINVKTELERNKEELKDLNNTKDKFFSIIAHDLKGPFNTLVGFSNILLENIQRKDYDKVEKYSTIIQQSSERTMLLLNNLLQWSRSQTGNITFTPTTFNVYDLIINEIELLQETANKKGVTITPLIESTITISGDENMLHTVVRNLLSNAIKYVKSGGLITIVSEKHENEFRISVQDNGIGIREENIKNIFKIDRNYTTPGTDNETGTGLGLIICREFIEKHNGKIWVNSSYQKGSIFTFSIPL